MRVGVLLTTTSTPPASISPYSTATCFAVGVGDTGPVGTPIKCESIADVTTAIGPRSSTNLILWDFADTYFRENGSILYLSRVVGTTPVNASLVLQDAGPHPTVVITSKYPGVAPNSYSAAVTTAAAATFTANTTNTSPNLASVSSFANIGPGTAITGAGIPAGTYILSVNPGAGTAVMSANASATASSVTVTPTAFTLTLTDANANALETHGPFINTAALYADTSSTLVNFAQSAGSGFTINNPATLTATVLAGGTDDHGTATINSWTTALNAFISTLGPGQVCAPGQTNTTLAGIWSALGTHAQAKNRVAICNMRDGQTPATLIADLGAFGVSTVAGYCAFWPGLLTIPGISPGTTRTTTPDAAIAALCSQADSAGNPNQAAGFDAFPLAYVQSFTSAAGGGTTVNYLQADIDSLNAAGINVFNTVFGVLQNYGFVTPVSPLVDSVYWQFNHSRLRMALEADFQVVGQPFVGSQIDGKGHTIAAFSGQLASELQGRVRAGAIYTQAPNGTQDQGFVVDTGPTVNTPTTIAAGQLNANVSVRMAPFAQLVDIALSSVPITQNL